MRSKWASALAVAVIALTAVVVANFSASAAGEASLFGDARPSVVSDFDTGKVELGLQFKTSIGGTVQGIRFYKGPRNVGTHVGYLYSGSTRLASVTFTNETAGGWQRAIFSAPVKVVANQTYTASYLASVGGYSVTNPQTFPVTSGALTAIRGVYRYGGGYPSNVYQKSNYFVDILFVPTTGTTTNSSTQSTTSRSSSVSTSATSSASQTTASTTSTQSSTSSSSSSSVPSSTPPPAATGWPSSITTGVPSGVALTPSGSITITTPGQVLDSKDISGSVVVKAANVTIRTPASVDPGRMGSSFRLAA